MNSIWDFIRRKPTEVVFSLIIAVFIGSRVYQQISSMIFDDESKDINDELLSEMTKEALGEDMVAVDGVGNMHISQIRSG